MHLPDAPVAHSTPQGRHQQHLEAERRRRRHELALARERPVGALLLGGAGERLEARADGHDSGPYVGHVPGDLGGGARHCGGGVRRQLERRLQALRQCMRVA